MLRPVCLCALAFACVAFWGAAITIARAEQSEPASPTKQADPKPVSLASVKLQNPPAAGVGTGQPAQNPPPAKPTMGPGPVNLPQVTPAEQRYGLPKNPIVGGPVDTDLSKPLTLERAIQIGLLLQNQIAIAQTQTVQANARLTQARASYFPQVTPSLQYQNSRTPGRVQGVGVPFITDQRADLIAAHQLIYDGGKREATVGLSRRNVFAAEYGLGNQRQSVIETVTIDYFTLMADRELVRVQQENVRRAQTTRDVIQAEAAVGLAAQSDINQTLADLANAQVALLQAQNNADLAQAALKNSMGVVTSQPLILPNQQLPPPSTTPDPISLDRYVQVAYQNRLDVRQQQEAINAQGYNVRIARINSGLTVQADVTEGYALDPNAGEERDFIVSFSYPLFDAGSTRAAVRENKALLEQDRRTLDQLEQTVRLNVEQAYVNREQARQRIVAANAAVDAGQVNYNVALEKQRAGLVNIPEVVNAETALVTAQVSQIQAIYDFYIADAMLQREIGVNDPNYLPRVPKVQPPVRP